MNRGERRELNKRKWHNKLKTIFNAKVWDWYKPKNEHGRIDLDKTIHPAEWKDMLNTKDGVAYKETGTIWHNPKTDKDYHSAEKDIHKRDLSNKSLSKEDKEELEDAIEALNNPYSFEDYCGACRRFGEPDECPFFEKVHDHTRWADLRCEDFMN